ncbi:hypothetical protein Isop_2584 [Isosphaera pallida ATCC 43644]|uniref:Uncharacterized protein n=1 Tax=Isosphaera pallida (strain ATCC 43644 / DSM 9630 / IS1B) TaxID=575540 RepID=E8QZ13_ISOPI|nr:hypothetical protein [Isosphaera pallida]ADV63155.1 hypothetical protein Isop_2584 [Isosphaera pallida ATCC 43644]
MSNLNPGRSLLARGIVRLILVGVALECVPPEIGQGVEPSHVLGGWTRLTLPTARAAQAQPPGERRGLFQRLFNRRPEPSPIDYPTIGEASRLNGLPSGYDQVAPPSLTPPTAGEAIYSSSGGDLVEPARPYLMPNDPSQPTAPAMPPGQPIQPTPNPALVRVVNEPFEPLLTRVTLIRTPDGNSFGVSMHLFTNGWIIDGQGPHRLTPEEFARIRAAARAVKGQSHRGTSPGGVLTQQSHYVVFEKTRHQTYALPFVISGDLSNAPTELRQLHEALDELAIRLAGPATPGAGSDATATATAATATVPQPDRIAAVKPLTVSELAPIPTAAPAAVETPELAEAPSRSPLDLPDALPNPPNTMPPTDPKPQPTPNATSLPAAPTNRGPLNPNPAPSTAPRPSLPSLPTPNPAPAAGNSIFSAPFGGSLAPPRLIPPGGR